MTANQLGLTLRDVGRYLDAEPIFRRTSSAFREQLGGHYYTGAALGQLADVLHRTGRPAEAEALYREGLAILEDVIPDTHATVALHRSRFGYLLVTLGRYDAAEALLLSSHEVFLVSGGEDHDFTRETAGYLLALYDAWDRPEEAAIYAAASPGS